MGIGAIPPMHNKSTETLRSSGTVFTTLVCGNIVRNGTSCSSVPTLIFPFLSGFFFFFGKGTTIQPAGSSFPKPEEGL